MYKGNEAPIPLGQIGLKTDDPMTSLPPNAGILANNVRMLNSTLQKSPGSQIYNPTPLTAPIIAAHDWWPLPTSQYLIALTSDGKVWRDSGDGTFNSNTPIGTGLSSLASNTTDLVDGGAETPADLKKLFIFTGSNIPKVIRGSTTNVGSIAYPPTDWVNGNFPITGCVFSNRMVGAAKHTIYLSNSLYQNTTTAASLGLAIPTWASTNWYEVTDTPMLDWFATTPVATVTHYQVALGSTPGGTNIVGYTNVGTSTSYRFTGLTLTNGSTYYATVQGLNASNAVVYTSQSEGFLVNTSLTSNTVSSSIYGHEDFRGPDANNPQRDASIFPVFPGEGDGIYGLQVYKGRLFIFKKPFGVYYIDDNGSTSMSQWSIKKLTDSFGIASPHAAILPLDDLVAGNVSNSITSIQATQAFGDVKSGDLLAINQLEYYYKSVFDPSGIPFMQAIYYAEKKMAMFTGRTAASTTQNLILTMDVARTNARFFIENKDQPTCLFLKKDSSLIPRPWYGADNGHVYQMESPNYSVGGLPYTGEFQTPYIDFSYLDGKLSAKNKIFDFLEVQYQAVGNYPFYVDVYVDNKFTETVTYNQFAGAALDSFVLDRDRLAVPYTQNLRMPLHGTGKRISLRIYNNNLNQYFQVEKLIVSFRISGEQNKPVSGVFKI